jgi:hypothetical protein
MASRFDDVRLRARRVKTALIASAVALFALMGLAVRAAHPGATSAGTRRPTAQLVTPAAFESALNQGAESSNDGFIAPAQGPPAAATSTS